MIFSSSYTLLDSMLIWFLNQLRGICFKYSSLAFNRVDVFFKEENKILYSMSFRLHAVKSQSPSIELDFQQKLAFSFRSALSVALAKNCYVTSIIV
jgi:hypothetical protein